MTTLCMDTKCGMLARDSGYCDRHEPMGASTPTELASIREHVLALTAERDEMLSRANDLGLAVAEERSKADSLRARVAELEAHLEAASEQGREWLRERDTAREAALEEAKVELNSLNVLGVPWAFAGILAVLDRLKTKPSRRFVDAEKVAKLEQALRDMLASADCEWENRKQGHDWAEACQQARDVLSEVNP